MLKRPKYSLGLAFRTGLWTAGCLALLIWINMGSARAAETGAEDITAASQAMQGAEKDFQRAEEDFRNAVNANAAQTTATMPLSGMNAQTSTTYAGTGAGAAASSAQTMAGTASPVLQGSPETGYAGTWTDPRNGDIITSVIAPTPRQSQNYGQYPIIIEPNIGSWNSSGGSGSNWSGNNPQWPTTPDNPGWGTSPGSNFAPASPPPPPPPFTGPGNYPAGGNFYPSPPLPPNFHPGYRPLYPPAPGHWQNPGGPGGASRPPSIPPGVFPAHPGGGWNSGSIPNIMPGINQGLNPATNPDMITPIIPGMRPTVIPGVNQGLNPGASSGQGWNRPPNFPIQPRPGMAGRPGSNSYRGMP